MFSFGVKQSVLTGGSISIRTKEIEKSIEFYTKLGFELKSAGGDQEFISKMNGIRTHENEFRVAYLYIEGCSLAVQEGDSSGADLPHSDPTGFTVIMMTDNIENTKSLATENNFTILFDKSAQKLNNDEFYEKWEVSDLTLQAPEGTIIEIYSKI